MNTLNLFFIRCYPQAAGSFPWGILRDHPQEADFHLHWAGAGAAHLWPAHYWHRWPKGQHWISQIPVQLHPGTDQETHAQHYLNVLTSMWEDSMLRDDDTKPEGNCQISTNRSDLGLILVQIVFHLTVATFYLWNYFSLTIKLLYKSVIFTLRHKERSASFTLDKLKQYSRIGCILFEMHLPAIKLSFSPQQRTTNKIYWDIYNLSPFVTFSFFPFTLDPVVLEGLAVLWPGGPGQVLTVCHRHVQGSPSGFCRSGRNERHPEVSDPPWWSLHWPPAICSYLVNP